MGSRSKNEALGDRHRGCCSWNQWHMRQERRSGKNRAQMTQDLGGTVRAWLLIYIRRRGRSFCAKHQINFHKATKKRSRSSVPRAGFSFSPRDVMVFLLFNPHQNQRLLGKKTGGDEGHRLLRKLDKNLTDHWSTRLISQFQAWAQGNLGVVLASKVLNNAMLRDNNSPT